MGIANCIWYWSKWEIWYFLGQVIIRFMGKKTLGLSLKRTECVSIVGKRVISRKTVQKRKVSKLVGEIRLRLVETETKESTEK